MPTELDRFLKENKYIPGNIKPLLPYGKQTPVTDKEKKIFDAACGDYQFWDCYQIPRIRNLIFDFLQFL